MNPTEFISKRSLTPTDVTDIAALEAICNEADGIEIKFNWEMMKSRDAEFNTDFFAYRDGNLVGYMPLDGFGSKYEVTCAVLPAYRKQGIFKHLLETATQEAKQGGAKQLLLVNYRPSESGNAAVKALNLPYRISEYRMEADAATMPSLPATSLELVNADRSDIPELARLMSLAFGNSPETEAEDLTKRMQQNDGRYFLAKREGETIGQIGVVQGDNGIYIRGVGIVPEWRRQGYGRQLLSSTLQKMLAEGHSYFELDVETENNGALSLYESCGFRAKMVYDYYNVPLVETSA